MMEIAEHNMQTPKSVKITAAMKPHQRMEFESIYYYIIARYRRQYAICKMFDHHKYMYIYLPIHC